MKRLFALAAIALFAFSHTTELPIGSPLPTPDVPLRDISGKMVTLQSAMQEAGLLVMFSCNTCPYVLKNTDRTAAIAKYALDNKVGVILVNSNTVQRSSEDAYEAMQAFGRKMQYNWHYVVDDGAVVDAFDAKKTPECFLFDKNKKLVYHGAIDDSPADEAKVSREHLRTAIDEMRNGRAVSVTTSRSVGCSIKRG